MQVRYFRQSVFLDYMYVVLEVAPSDHRKKLAIQSEIAANRAKRLSEPSLSISSASSARSPRPISIHSDPISIAAFFTPSFYLETRVILSLVLWSGLDGCSDEFRFGVSDLTLVVVRGGSEHHGASISKEGAHRDARTCSSARRDDYGPLCYDLR